MKRSDEFKKAIEAIKKATTCVAIAQSIGLPIEKSGDRCASFIHKGTNPNSMVVNDDYWYSFSDAMGGDVIDLLALHDYDGDRGQAIRHLSDMLGIPLPTNEYSRKWQEYTNDLQSKVEMWHKNLDNEHLKYLHNRKINDETINRLKIGFKFDENRLIIPMWKNGYVCYWCGRTMGEVTENNPKYRKPKLNGFNENDVFGLDTLNRDKSILVIAEGAFDYLSFYQEGYAVLSMAGGTFSKKQTKHIIQIARNFGKVLLTFDNDKSGGKFTVSMARTMFSNHIPFIVSTPPKQYKDISEYYQDGGNLSKLIDNAEPGIRALAKMFKDKEDFEDFIITNRRFIKKTDIIEIFENVLFPDASREWLNEVKKQALKPPSDDEIAKIVLKKHKLMHNPSLGILEYNGRYWQMMGDDNIRRYIGIEFGITRTQSKINSVLGLIKADTVTDKLPNRKPLINFINGTFEIETGILREHSPDDFITYELNYPYNPNTVSDDWNHFINSIFDDPKKIELLQEYSGYVLYPDNILQCALYLVGNGANGKSVYLKTIRLALGGESNVSSVELTAFNDKFQLINLMGKMANISTETKTDSKSAETNFKSVVTGDPIQACYKGKDFVLFEPRCKLFFGCNELPKSRDLTDGFTRRMLILKFPYKFTDNPIKDNERLADVKIESKLATPENLSGIFNWIYDGYKKISKTNKFTVPDDQLEQMEEYKETANPIVLFTKEFEWKQMQYYDSRPPEIVDVDFISNRDLMQMYLNWSSANNYQYSSNMQQFKKSFIEAAKEYRPDILAEKGTKFKGIRGIRRKEKIDGEWVLVDVEKYIEK